MKISDDIVDYKTALKILSTLEWCEPNDDCGGMVGKVPQDQDTKELADQIKTAGYQVSTSKDETDSYIWVIAYNE